MILIYGQTLSIDKKIWVNFPDQSNHMTDYKL